MDAIARMLADEAETVSACRYTTISIDKVPVGHPDADREWTEAFWVLCYGFVLAYFFLGVSIIADVFMSAIEVITSRRKQKMLNTGQVITVKVWNDTVANLSLMALGSSAPEILLAVTEILGNSMEFGELGPATIVGSAAFNLFMIIGLCIFVIPSTETRKVQEMPAFFVTVCFMFVAYGWMAIIVAVITPDVVEIWEALVTLFLLPVLIYISYLSDIGTFGEFGKTMEVRREDVACVCQLLCDFERPTIDAIRVGLSEKPDMLKLLEAPSSGDIAELRRMVRRHCLTKKSRAVARIEATRLLTGGKKIQWDKPPTIDHTLRVTGISCASIQDIFLALPKGTGPAVVQFAVEAQCMSQAESKAVLITRTGDCSEAVHVTYGVIAIPKPQRAENAKRTWLLRQKSDSGSSLGDLKCAAAELFKGVSNAREDQCSEVGTAKFGADQDTCSVSVTVPTSVGNDETHQFAVVLFTTATPEGDESTVALGAVSRTVIVVRQAEAMSRLLFPYSSLLIQGSQEEQTMQIVIQRKGNTDGPASCAYRTERLRSVPGINYEHIEGTVEFEGGATETIVELKILPRREVVVEDDFLLVLEDADGADFDSHTDGGADSEVLTIEIGPTNLLKKNFSTTFLRWLDRGFNFDEIRLGHEEWGEQIAGSFYCNGSKEEQQEASWVDFTFHLIALPWKIVFICVPPTAYCGGWICFWSSLCVIGALTAVIGSVAEVFGCSLGIPDLITAIIFVALGTSMPDLFASKSAACDDPTADAAIVNVTGSNCVNVFLGLGLPWSIAAIYWRVSEWDPAWAIKYPDIAQLQLDSGSDHMQFVVRSGDLVFSVGVFFACAMLGLKVILTRRLKIGAELGGPFSFKLLSSLVMVGLWVSYIWLSGWWSLRGRQIADGTERGLVFCFGLTFMLLPSLVFTLVAAQQRTPRETVMSSAPKDSPTKNNSEAVLAVGVVEEQARPEADKAKVEEIESANASPSAAAAESDAPPSNEAQQTEKKDEEATTTKNKYGGLLVEEVDLTTGTKTPLPEEQKDDKVPEIDLAVEQRANAMCC